MPGFVEWASGDVQVLSMVASGQGAQLGNGTIVQLTTNLNNTGVSGGPGFFATAELVTSASGFGAAVLAQQSIDFYLVPARDGTNFATASTSGLPPSSFRGDFVTPVSGNVSRLSLVIEGIPLVPDVYQGWIKNNAGQTLTSGWSCFINLHANYYT